MSDSASGVQQHPGENAPHGPGSIGFTMETVTFSKVLHENAAMRNLLVAWQNAFKDTETALQRSERDKAEVIKECGEQVTKARKSVYFKLVELQEENGSCRQEILDLRKQLHFQIKEVSRLTRANQELTKVLSSTKDQMKQICLKNEAAEKEMYQSLRELAKDVQSHPNDVLQRQCNKLAREKQELLVQNVHFLNEITRLNEEGQKLKEEIDSLGSVRSHSVIKFGKIGMGSPQVSQYRGNQSQIPTNNQVRGPGTLFYNDTMADASAGPGSITSHSSTSNINHRLGQFQDKFNLESTPDSTVFQPVNHNNITGQTFKNSDLNDGNTHPEKQGKHNIDIFNQNIGAATSSSSSSHSVTHNQNQKTVTVIDESESRNLNQTDADNIVESNLCEDGSNDSSDPIPVIGPELQKLLQDSKFGSTSLGERVIKLMNESSALTGKSNLPTNSIQACQEPNPAATATTITEDSRNRYPRNDILKQAMQHQTLASSQLNQYNNTNSNSILNPPFSILPKKLGEFVVNSNPSSYSSAAFSTNAMKGFRIGAKDLSVQSVAESSLWNFSLHRAGMMQYKQLLEFRRGAWYFNEHLLQTEVKVDGNGGKTLLVRVKNRNGDSNSSDLESSISSKLITAEEFLREYAPKLKNQEY